VVCESGYHFCFQPHDCDTYYRLKYHPRHALVQARYICMGTDKAASGQLRVMRELDDDEWSRLCLNPWLGRFSHFKGLYHHKLYTVCLWIKNKINLLLM